jgi:tetratricopeptide (TPR) repeat protein
MNCEAIECGEVAEKYVLGQLSASDCQAYETHYFECPRCLSELQTIESLQQELGSRSRKPAAHHKAPQKYQRWTWLAIAASVLLVVGLSWWTIRRSAERTIAHVPASANPLPASPDRRAATLELLARVDPPAYRLSNLRGSAGAAEVRFLAAMEPYRKGDYRSALPALEAAARHDPTAGGPRFFAGICQLIQGQPDQANASFERVISLGESPYLEKAHFYQAKAYLLKRDLAAAARALDATVRLKGDLEGESLLLLQQLRQVQQVAP